MADVRHAHLWAVDRPDWVIDNVSIDSSRVRSRYRPIIRAGIVAEDKTGGLLTCAIISAQNLNQSRCWTREERDGARGRGLICAEATNRSPLRELGANLLHAIVMETKKRRFAQKPKAHHRTMV